MLRRSWGSSWGAYDAAAAAAARLASLAAFLRARRSFSSRMRRFRSRFASRAALRGVDVGLGGRRLRGGGRDAPAEVTRARAERAPARRDTGGRGTSAVPDTARSLSARRARIARPRWRAAPGTADRVDDGWRRGVCNLISRFIYAAALYATPPPRSTTFARP